MFLMSKWQTYQNSPKKRTYKFTSEEYEDRRETRDIWLSVGGRMTINYIRPEEDDNPWDNDNQPLGPQAA